MARPMNIFDLFQGIVSLLALVLDVTVVYFVTELGEALERGAACFLLLKI
jgi:hypothetical protein